MALTSTQQRDLIKVGIGLFGAALGSTYLNEFALAIERGDSVSSIYKAVMASSFAQSSGLYPSYLSNEQFATRFVENLAGTSLAGDAKAQAIAYVKGQLDASTVTPDSAKRAAVVESVINLLDTIDAAEATFGAAAKQFDNRVTVATYYSIEFGGSATSLSGLQSVVNNVTNTTDVSTSTAIMTVINSSGSGVNGSVYTLTTSIDNLAGTSGNDTYNGSSVDANATGTTINPGDNISGGQGIDTLSIAVSGTAASPNIQGVTLAGIEKVLVSDFNSDGGANHKVDMALADSSLTTVGLSSSDASGTVEFTGLKKVVDAEMKNGANSLTLSFASGNTGTADALTLDVAGQTSGTFTANGIETMTVNSTLVKSAVTLAGDTLQNIVVKGGTEVSVSTTASTLKSVDASAATGKVTVNTGTVDPTTLTVKGGAGTTDVFSTAVSTVTNTVLKNVSGFETLAATAAGGTVTLTAAVTGVSTVDLSDTGIQTLNLNTGYAGDTTVKVGGTGNDIVNNTANVNLTVTGTDAAFNSIAITGGTGTDTLSIGANAGTASLGSATGIEAVKITANTTDATKGVTLTGLLAASGKTVTVDASALTSSSAAASLTATASQAGMFSVTGGAGNDTINLNSSTGNNTVNGGTGNDTITGGLGADSLIGGAGNDRFVMNGNLTSADVIDGGEGTDTLVVTSITDATAFSKVTNVEQVAISGASSVTLTAALSAAATFDLTDADNQSLTFGKGYTGDTTVLLTGDSTNADTVVNTANVSLTVKANVADIDAATVITGGTGTDALILTADSDTANLTGVTAVETVTINANSTDATKTATLTSVVAASGKTVTVDATALTNSAATFSLTAGTSAGALSVKAGAGADTITLTSSSGKNTVDGGAGNDSITAGSGIDSLAGGAGNDTIDMSGVALTTLTFDDSVDGGEGTDTLKINSTGGTIGDAGQFAHVSNIETLADIGTGTVSIGASTPNFTTYDLSNSGNQILLINAGYANAVSVKITGDDTNADKVTNSANVALTVTGNVADVDAATSIIGGTGTDALVLTADNGSADLTASSSIDTITIKAGSTPTSTASVTLGAATVIASGKTLTVDASALTNAAAAFTYNGSAEADKQSVTGGAGNDQIQTGSGADTIVAGAGADVIDSGAGIDTITTGSGADVVTINTNTNALEFATVTDFEVGDALAFVAKGADTFNSTAVSLSPAAALSDYINAAAAGNGGTDGITRWFKFGGNTYVVVDNSAGTNFVAGTDRVIALTGEIDLSTATFSGAGGDTAASRLTSGSSANNLATASADALVGTASADTIDGLAGADTITGNAGDDSLVGGSGADSITGGDGADTITGGADADTIDGGAGNDLFIVASATDGNAAESYTGGADTDTLRVTGTTAIDFSANTLATLETLDLTTDTGIQTLTLTAAQRTAFTTVNADAADILNIKTLTGATVAGTGAIDRFVFTNGDVNAVINTFTSATDKLNVDALTTETSVTTITGTLTDSGKFYILTGATAGAADNTTDAATAITGGATWTSGASTSYVIIVDNNSTGIFKWVDAGGNGATAGELSIVGTVSAVTVAGDFLFA